MDKKHFVMDKKHFVMVKKHFALVKKHFAWSKTTLRRQKLYPFLNYYVVEIFDRSMQKHANTRYYGRGFFTVIGMTVTYDEKALYFSKISWYWHKRASFHSENSFSAGNTA